MCADNCFDLETIFRLPRFVLYGLKIVSIVQKLLANVNGLH